MAALGIDTSCYTTSVALSQDGEVAADLRKKLEVEEGGLGLRQSQALYMHIRNLPDMMEEAFKVARRDGIKVDSVAVSAWPRRVEGSYMPVFNAGRSVASAVASSLGLNLIEVSHQEGHIAACAPEAGLSPGDTFLAVHMSGGTTEVLEVLWGEGEMGIDVVAATTDISAGQMIDRVGAALKLPFPAGPALEMLALRGEGTSFRIPSSVQGGRMSFSGPCEAAIRGIRAGEDPGCVARAVLDCIIKSVSSAVIGASEGTGIRTALMVGGVASNERIRQGLIKKLDAQGIEVLFGMAGLSSDNAVGVSYLGELWV